MRSGELQKVSAMSEGHVGRGPSTAGPGGVGRGREAGVVVSVVTLNVR